MTAETEAGKVVASMGEREVKRLHVVSGVMTNGSHFEILGGCLLALNHDEARGAHTAWMLAQKPGYSVHSCHVFQLADDFILAAADLLRARALLTGSQSQ